MPTVDLNPSAVLSGPHEIEVEDLPLQPLKPYEVRMKISYAGVCSTDLALYSGDYPVPLPLVPGHEFSATVVEAGQKVRDSWVGQRVVCSINNSCTVTCAPLCAACRRGMAGHCLQRTVTGIVNHPGAFARYLAAPVGNLHKIPDNVSDQTAVLVEPLAAALRTFELTPLKSDDKIVVLGCGRLGRLISHVAKQSGAEVAAVVRTEKSAALASTVARHVYINNDRGKLVSDIKRWTDGLGADIVVEATGDTNNLDLAADLVRPRGTISLKSTSGVEVTNFNTTRIIVDEITIQTSRCGRFDAALEFIARHQAPNESWITEVFPLAEISRALETAKTSPKVLIRPS